MRSSRLTKFIVIPLLIVVMLGPIFEPFAQGFSFPDRYDMVTVLVEQGLYADPTDYNGLVGAASGPITRTNLKQRVDRYATDLQNALPGTRVAVIQVDRFEKPENITAVLERLYFEGDPKEPTRIAYLKGVVLIGEVPLPVVNKNGNRFISLFPYTDFEQKAYVWSPATQDFELRQENPNPQPELWHGVIRPPLSTQSPQGKQLLAAYFDKNHLYHVGDANYATFDKKIFFQDFFHERKNLNAIAYKNYLNFLDHQGDIAYVRYTKGLFGDLSGPVDQDLAQDQAESADIQARLERSGIPFDSNVPRPSLASNGAVGAGINKNAIPDIMTKFGKMSDNLMFRFNQIFTKYPNLINDFIGYTGRYTEVDSAVNLITAKDQFTISYLKAVNTMVEKKVDDTVNSLQKNIPLTNNAQIVIQSVGIAVAGKSEPQWFAIDSLPDFALASASSAAFTNYSADGFLNGVAVNAISSAPGEGVPVCTPYRGSKGAGAYSKLVEFNRALDLQSGAEKNGENPTTGRTPAEINATPSYKCQGGDGTCVGYRNFAGCFYDGAGLYANPPAGNARVCFPEAATDPVYEAGGTRARSSLPTDGDNFRACITFHEKNQYAMYVSAARGRAADIADSSDTPEKIRISQGSLPSQDKDPTTITLLASPVTGDLNLTLGDVLRALGWDATRNSNGWHDTLNTLIASGASSHALDITMNKGILRGVRLAVTRAGERSISSVMYHKEPSPQTLKLQLQNLITSDLPVDNPRYTTFQDLAGNVRRIIYPDIFAEPSVEAYVTKLRAIEGQLSTACSSCLTTLISDLPEQATTPPGTDVVIARANRAKTLDALQWREMDIDSKHNYMMQYYLDAAKNPYIGQTSHGYEMIYLNGEGTGDTYQFSENPSVEEEEDAAFSAAQESAEALHKDPSASYELDPNNPFDRAPDAPTRTTAGSYDLFSWTPPPTSPWWERMQEWSSGLTTTVNQFKFGESQDAFYKQQHDEAAQALADVKNEQAQIESHLTTADTLDLSRVAKIDLSTDSSVAAVGKKVDIIITLKDKKDKVVRDEFVPLTLTLDGDARFDSALHDESVAASGVQVTMTNGVMHVGVVTSNAAGTATLNVVQTGTARKANLAIKTVDNATLVLSASTVGVVANGTNIIEVNVTAQDGNGTAISGARGTIALALSNPAMGTLLEPKINLVNGKGSFRVKVGKKKGTVIVNATAQPLNSGQLTLQFLPGPPVRIGLTADADILPAVAGSTVGLHAALFDAQGNLVDTNFGTQISFRLTEKTAKFGVLSSAHEVVHNGVADTTLAPRQESGAMNILAEAQGLAAGAITIRSMKQFGSEELATMKPNGLTAALLGIPAGDVSQNNNLGGWFTMNGTMQAVTTLTTAPQQFAKLFEVTAQGGLRLPDPARISSYFVPANNFTMVLHDNQLKTDVARMALYTTKNGHFDVTEVAAPDELGDGIYLRNLGVDRIYSVDKIKGALRLTKSESEKMEIQENGYVKIFDNNFSVRPRDGNFLTLQVFDKETPVAEIYFVQRFNQDVVSVVTTQAQLQEPSAPGVYLTSFKLPPFIKNQFTFSGNSSADPHGVSFYDTREEVKGAGAPGFSYNSPDKSLSNFGVGFTQDNKFALLFAAGESFGEANRSYASDAGIILGDPSVRLDNTDPSNFSSDVGKLLYSAATDIKGIINLDYNSDGYEDILIVQDDSKIRLIQNNGGYNQLKDMGYLFNIKNGIQDLTKLDANNDRQMDLAIAAKESCRKGDTCIDIYENHGGAFVRTNLQIDEKEKIMTLKAVDLNNDSFADLVFANTAGDIKVLYNKSGKFESTPQLVGNMGLKVDAQKNLAASVLLSYSGMAQKNPRDPAASQNYYTLSVQEPNPGAGNEGFAGAIPAGAKVTIEPSFQYTEKDFIYADLDTAGFAKSTKFAVDLNGGVVQTGDSIRYTLTLQNDSATAKRNLMVSDVVGEQLELDEKIIACTDCGADQMKIERLNGDATRPLLFKNITVPAHGARHIVYEAIYKGTTKTADKIILTFNNRFDDADATIKAALQRDTYTDIAATKESNGTGRVRYFYTTGVDQSRRLVWGSALSSAPQPETADSLNEKLAGSGVDIPKSTDFLSGNVPDDTKKKALDAVSKDSDGDGIPDSIDDLNGGLDRLATTTAAVVKSLTCDAGCIAMPVNIAFLAPGLFSILGVPAGFDPGIPVVGWGLPAPPFVAPGPPGLGGLGGRFYVSPTLTGGIGFALCLGPYGTPKNCFSFGLNPLDLVVPGICDKINGSVSGALASAKDSVGSLTQGTTITMGNGNAPVGGRRASGSGLGNYSLGSYDAPVTKERNVRIPGFPAPLTDWFSRQLEELTDKVTDLPDLYLLYPDPGSIAGSFQATQKFNRTGDFLTNLLTYLNSIPLIDIQTQEVIFKVPLITRKEIEKFKADARQWVEDERLELDSWRNAMGCVTGDSELCRVVTTSISGAIDGITANAKALDEWIVFPKRILQYRAAESYYLGQIIDYLDTVIQFTGGWVKKNTARVAEWRRAVREIKDTITTWKALVNLMVEYNESCDKCKTERYSLKDLILKLFVAVPSPPVIPLPKLPDIVIDVSKIQAGVKIMWPDVQFQPESISLPKLPRIKLGPGITTPQFNLQFAVLKNLPKIPSPPSLPELPALPPLSLPKLPDIPPPPKLPKLPDQIQGIVSVLKKVVKILCIIRLGIVPTDEFLLKTRIEEITARGLSPVLPLDMLFTVQSPSISVTYVDQLIVTAFTNFNFDFSYLKTIVEEAAKKANAFSTDFAKGANTYTKNASEQAEKVTNPPRLINYLNQVIGADSTELVQEGMKLQALMLSLEETRKVDEKITAAVPSSFGLTMETQPYVVGMVKDHAVADDLVLPFQKRLKNYRDRLVAYQQDTEELLNHSSLSDELNDMARYIASARSPFEKEGLKRYLAATNFEQIASAPAGRVHVGEWNPETTTWAPMSMASSTSRLVALGPPSIPNNSSTPGQGGPSGIGSIRNIGIFYIAPDGQSMRLVDYTLEAEKTSKLADIDLENDGVTDKVYSYGKNVFVKRNNRISYKETRPIFRPDDLEFWTIYELLPKGTSPNFPKSINETARTADMSVGKTVMSDVAGYEVLSKTSPYFFENAGSDPTIRTHLMPEPGEGSLNVGVVKKVAGRATIKNSASDVATPLSAGTTLSFGDVVKVEAGLVVIRYAKGGDTALGQNETFTIQRLVSEDNLTASLNVEPGFYFTKIAAFDAEGVRSSSSEKVLLAPQICGDTSPPIADAGKAEFTIAVGKTLSLNAQRSFDSQSKVVSYKLNTDTSSARATVIEGTTPEFTVGPYAQVGDIKMQLMVRDEALNEGTRDITVHVVTPTIILDVPPLRSNIISGSVTPAESHLPISIARLRQGLASAGWELLTTKSADANGHYFTDEKGRFKVEDLDMRDRLVLRNSENVVVAEINRTTGRITILDARYETRFVYATKDASGEMPTRIGVYLKADPKSAAPLTFVYFIPDVNIDTTLDPVATTYDEKNTESMHGVHIKPLPRAGSLGLTFEVLPTDHPQLPGATVVKKDQTVLGVVDVNGDITAQDPSLTVAEKSFGANAGNQPVVFEMRSKGDLIAEIFVAVRSRAPRRISLLDEPKAPPRPTPLPPQEKKQPFSDVAAGDALGTTLIELHDKGIVGGYSSVAGELLFKPERPINRAEFTQITLKMLCILPREEAKKLPSPFFDVLDPSLWFYPILKEGNMRTFIRGYLGEAKINPDTGAKTTPFKPANDINRAEATTIVLYALQEEDIIDMSRRSLVPKVGEQWYTPFMEIAKDLKPYLKRPLDAKASAFLLTAAEALNPGKNITRREFAIMAQRVLAIHDCSFVPTPAPVVVPPAPAPVITTATLARALIKNVEGIFVLRPACTLCPCRATISPGEDLQPGDLIFAAITGAKSLPIYAKSNEEIY